MLRGGAATAVVLFQLLILETHGQSCAETSFSTLRTNGLFSGRLPTVFDNSVTLFNVPFSCDGRIQSWSGVAQRSSGNSDQAFFQVWRKLSKDLFSLVASIPFQNSVIGRTSYSRLDGVFTDDNPVYVKQGDIVGYYAPLSSSYLLAADVSSDANVGSSVILIAVNNVCTFETCHSDVFNTTLTYLPRLQITVDTSDTAGATQPPSCEPWLFEPCAAPPTTLPTATPTATPNSTQAGNDSAGNNAGAIAAGVVVSLLLVAILVAVVVVVVVFVVWKVRRDEGLYVMTEKRTTVNDDQYATIRATEKQRTIEGSAEPVYAHVDPRDSSNMSLHYEFDSSPVPNPMYRQSFSSKTRTGISGITLNMEEDEKKRAYHILDGPSPTHEVEVPVPPYAVPLIHGRPLTSSVEVHSHYATALQDQFAEPKYATLMSGRSSDSQYWQPSDNETEIYAQLEESHYMEIHPHSVKLGKFIGSGQFALVHKGVWVSSAGSFEVAVKQVKENLSGKERVKFLQEAAIMGQFSHPGIVTMFGVIKEHEKPMIVLEYLPKGDLRHHLSSIKPRNRSGNNVNDLPKKLLKFCRQIASGMTYLSSKGFIHRDLAARNILVTDEGDCKIADFGLSRDLADEDYYIMKSGRIPLKWSAPEAIHYKKFSTKGDVWSYAVVLWEIWALGKKPFANLNNVEAFQQIVDGMRLPPPPGCSRVLYKLMVMCWHPEASQRPTFPSICDYLSKTDQSLLNCENKDMGNSPDAGILGKPLIVGSNLYKDLQGMYLSSTAGDYEVPVGSQ